MAWERWSDHSWTADAASDMLLADGKIIELYAHRDPGSRPLKVHAELLCHFSLYYRAALKGSFLEKDSPSLEVDESLLFLRWVVAWLYTGVIPGRTWPAEDHAERNRLMVDLFVFADTYDILALRRSVIDQAKRSGRPHALMEPTTRK